jgi:hypothetical protein
VEGEAPVPTEPGANLGMLMSGVIVENDVNSFAGRHLCLDGIEEADELLMAVALHVAADDGAIEHVERGEQGRGAVSLVIVRHRAGAALLQGQAGQGAVERLDLGLFVEGPSAMKRSCQRQTQVFDLAVRRMISFVPVPSAVKRTTLARQTCFCGTLRFEIRSCNRRRSADETMTEIPVRMIPDSHAPTRSGILSRIPMSDFHQ